MEIIFASSQNIDLIFYMLEKAQKYGFGSQKISKNINIIFASLKTLNNMKFFVSLKKLKIHEFNCFFFQT